MQKGRLFCPVRYLQCHRSDLAFKKIFGDAGLQLVRQKVQRGLPAGLYPVKMYVTDNLACWRFTDGMSYKVCTTSRPVIVAPLKTPG